MNIFGKLFKKQEDKLDMSMFCYQCEQTSKGKGCQISGACGKLPETANEQDTIVEKVKELAFYRNRLKKNGIANEEADIAIIKALFSTVTNVDFDTANLVIVEKNLDRLIEESKKQYDGSDVFEPLPENIEDRKKAFGEDIVSLQETIMYGLKGAAAYYDHAYVQGFKSEEIIEGFLEVLDFLTNKTPTVDDLLANALRAGEINFKVMELLDTANTTTFGHPEPTQVSVTAKKGKAILVSGHDLKDLGELLKQTEGKGINVYTHGEMLPCLAYPELKKYPHLVGNWGGAWQDQQKEFAAFPGAILMTTNCIINPRGYDKKIFTTGLVQWPGVQHVPNDDFSAVIEEALAQPGFAEDEEEKLITVGFGHNAVMSVADKVVDAVKAGDIKHFFLVGGCDGAKSGRNYYTEFAEKVPQDCVILTLACGKYRFNKMDFGDIGGIPRLLDIGQCNDAYSAIKIAVALSEAFETDVNSLPLSMVLSWFEQKAVAILLTLLHLGIKGIKLGPSLPAFITPNVLNVLVDKFEIALITTPEEDLKTILG